MLFIVILFTLEIISFFLESSRILKFRKKENIYVIV